jgi:hypothetical protein
VHKTAIAQAILARCSVNARDPQAAQLTSTIAAIAISVLERLHHRLIGTTEQTMLGAVLSFRRLEDLFVPSVGYGSTLYSCHVIILEYFRSYSFVYGASFCTRFLMPML